MNNQWGKNEKVLFFDLGKLIIQHFFCPAKVLRTLYDRGHCRKQTLKPLKFPQWPLI